MSRKLMIAAVAALCLSSACADKHLPTEVDEPRQRPSPLNPPPPPPPPPYGQPTADNRRSFIWSEEEGYTILQNPPGVILVGVSGINENGEVAGTIIRDWSAGGPIYVGFKWSSSLGFTYVSGPGGVNTYVTGIDDSGYLVGYTEAGTIRKAFLWKEAEGLRFLGVQPPFLHVVGIRAGTVFGNVVDGGRVAAYRLRISGGQLDLLQTLNEIGGAVMSVNGRGEAVGYDGYMDYGFGGTSDAVAWDEAGNRTVAYDCHAVWNCFAYLSGINASGLAVGSVKGGESEQARIFKWSRNTGITFLDVPPAGFETGVAGVNDDGGILVHNAREGFIFTPSGTMTVIRPPGTHAVVRPFAMNQRGQVVGMLF